MNNVIEILMNRDGCTYEEAKEIYEETQKEIIGYIEDGCDYDCVEDIMLDNIGLEMDYIFDFI